MNWKLAETASLVSDSARAAMLIHLLDGLALPAGELAMIANISPQTASSHLAKLVQGNMLSVEQQGRHRYYRLADSEVAHAIEAMLAISPLGKRADSSEKTRPTSGDIAYARSCYTHLAGQLAVQIAEAMLARGIIVRRENKVFKVTKSGRDWLKEFGITVHDRDLNDARFARQCLDWTERRHHLAGRLGSALFSRLRELRWIAPIRDSRAVRITLEGQKNLHRMLRT